MKLAYSLGLAALMVAAACSGDSSPADPTTGAPTTAAPTTATPTTALPVDIGLDWTNPELAVELGDGWMIRACEGEAPMLCAEHDGVAEGLVTAVKYPISSFDFIDPSSDVDAQLRAIAADYLTSFEADRTAGCGADYVFEPIDPRSFALGGNPGMTYGFVGTTAAGAPSESHRQYATILDGNLFLVVASAYEEGQCPGVGAELSFTTEELEQILPRLEELLEASPLPIIT